MILKLLFKIPVGATPIKSFLYMPIGIAYIYIGVGYLYLQCLIASIKFDGNRVESHSLIGFGTRPPLIKIS